MGYHADVHIDDTALRAALAQDVRRGLGAREKWLPPKYFYDAAGVSLFERITQLPEYYLSRAEQALLEAHAPAILGEAGAEEIVEVAAGAPTKAQRLLAAENGREPLARYVLIDVDDTHLDRVPPAAGRRLVAFLGSTLGNFDAAARHALLLAVRRLLGPDDRFLLGVDLVKSPRVLHAAYDDAEGVTAEFNRNILRVINRQLGADFDVDAFGHYARWDAEERRVEMHLVAGTDHAVHVHDLDMMVEFETGETIWTGSSYKFTHESVAAMLDAAGLALTRWDADSAFGLALAAPARAAAALPRAA
jgi:L-histidine N-alpha-methyltransferase